MKNFRESKLGRFVTKAFAKANPDTTQGEETREPFAAAWKRFVDSKEYDVALYYAATPEARPVGLRIAFEAGRKS